MLNCFVVEEEGDPSRIWPAARKSKEREEERRRERKKKVGVTFARGFSEVQRDFVGNFTSPIGFSRYFICDSSSLVSL